MAVLALVSTILALDAEPRATTVMSKLAPSPSTSVSWSEEARAHDQPPAHRAGFGFPPLEGDPGWSAGVEGYAGFAVLANGEGLWAHGLVGGLSRIRYGYFTLGGFLERTDHLEQGEWWAYGGVIGAYLPFRGSVQGEALAGFGVRAHREEDARYGSGGYSASFPTALVRFGISDRSTRRLLGLRLGCYAVVMVDLDRGYEDWRVEWATAGGAPVVYEGQTAVGGSSVGLALTLDFDIGEYAKLEAVN